MDIQAWLDQEDARIADRVRRFGWTGLYVGGDTCGRPGCTSPPDDGPPFAYTIGLFGIGHPELLVVGLDPAEANLVLDDLAGRVRDGETLVPGFPIAVEGWPRAVVPEAVPNPGDIVLWANGFYRRPPEHSVPVLQLTYSDDQGRFPWDEGYTSPHHQTRPGELIP
jgi:hypothetical protein